MGEFDGHMVYNDLARVEKLEGLLYQCLSTFDAMLDHRESLLDVEHVQYARDELKHRMGELDLPSYRVWKFGRRIPAALSPFCHTVSMDCFGNPPYNQFGLAGNSTALGCSECGAPWSTMGIFRGNHLKHNFKACPICGRKVVGE